MSNPTDEQALQFCIMLGAGLPASQAILYFVPDTERLDPSDIAAMLVSWQKSRAVNRAQKQLLGKSWQDMTLDERIRHGLDHHYNTLAYLLFSTHYAEVGPTDKGKLDSARAALEAKVAGTSGQSNPLSDFFADLKSGKIKIAAPIPRFVPEPVN